MTESTDIPTLLDADLLGKSTPAMEALLDKPAVFMAGQLYDQGDRRNSKDGDWKRTEFTWYEWMAMEKYGLANHPVAKGKQGNSLVFAEALEGARKDSAIKTMYAVGLDIDSGAALDDVIEKLIECELYAIVYTSFSHGKSKLDLKHDDIVRKLKLDDTPNRAQVQAYLREHHKDRFDADFIDGIKIVDARHQTKDGLRVIVETPPLDKFRVILPLAEPVELSDLGTTMTQWKKAWEDAVCGVAVNMLDVNFDASSCDVNRLFYTPRHPKDAEDWYAAIVQGDPLSFDEIEPYSKDSYVKKRDDSDPFAMGTEGGNEREIQMLPSGRNLNRWHKDHKERFLITDVIETFCDDKIRKAGGEKVGTVHIECPFEHEHSTSGGHGTMCMNPTENSEGYWTTFCRHDACSGRDKLEFVREMVEQGWFEESLLVDDQFNLGMADEDMEEEEPEPEEAEPEGIDAEIAKFTPETSTKDLLKFLKKQAKLGAEVAEQAAITTKMKQSTGLDKITLKRLWKTAISELRTAQDEEDNNSAHPDIGEWGFDEQIEYAENRIASVNRKSPSFFQYMEVLARIEDNAESVPRIVLLDETKFRSELNAVTTWFETKMRGENVTQRKVAMPADVGRHLFGSRYSVYPNLRGLTKTPVFTKEGDLITVPGYHEASGLYYQPDNSLDIPQVPKVPTEEDVFEAKRLFIEEMFADFPLGGYKREEIIEQALHGEGIPAVTHIISMVLLMFCREMIIGPTPGHLLTKPSPGTGASLLTDICSLIANGEVTPAMTIPPSDEEMQKTLIALMSDGSNILYFDNIDKDVNSGVLASAMTAPKAKGRLLGHSSMLEADVRCVWVMCGNNVRLSDELIRRLVMVDLDARMAHPEERSGWHHEDIGGWVRDNRGQLVWAALTLIQNWIAKGRPLQKKIILNSYENWSRIIGGICDEAGLGGFLSNRQELKERASDSGGDEINILLEAWWSHHKDKPVILRSNDESEESSLIGLALAEDLQLPIRLKQNADGDKTFDQNGFDGFLMKSHMQVFELSDEIEVTLRKDKKTKKGQYWKLEIVK